MPDCLMTLENSKNSGVSAIIIAYRGIDFIPDCMSSLKSDLANRVHEIIIVDNNSDDGTREYLEKNYPDIKLIVNPSNFGFARAVNQGIEAAKFDNYWILNQDIRVCPGCLDRLFECQSQLDKPGVIGPQLVGFDGCLQKYCRRFPNYWHLFCELSGLSRLFGQSDLLNGWKMGGFDHLQSRAVDQPMGSAMLISREAVNKIGLMDEEFFIFFNDVDFCHRLAEAGFINYYCVDAVLEHYGGGSVRKIKPRMVWQSHFDMFRYFRKWEKRRSSSIVRIIRKPLLYAAGAALVLAAIPRSLFHWLRKFI